MNVFKYIYIYIMGLQIDSEVAYISERKSAIFGIIILKMIKVYFNFWFVAFHGNFNMSSIVLELDY